MNIEGLERKINKKWKTSTYWKGEILIAKECPNCRKIKEIEKFGINRSTKSGINSICKECACERSRKKHKANPEYAKRWREKNKEYIKKKSAEYIEKNKEIIKEKTRKYMASHKKEHSEYNKKWRELNKEYIKERDRKYRKENAEHIKEINKQYHEKNREIIKEKKKQYREEVKKNNLQEISNLLEQINPTFKQLNLPIYGYIYKIENVKTRHQYLGQTILPLKRRYGCEGGIVKSWIKERMDKDTQKFKDELIEEDIEVTEVLDVAFCQYHLDKLEAYYINKYNSYNDGYNNHPGNHNTTDGLDEFNEILKTYNLQYIDGKLIKAPTIK